MVFAVLVCSYMDELELYMQVDVISQFSTSRAQIREAQAEHGKPFNIKCPLDDPYEKTLK